MESKKDKIIKSTDLDALSCRYYAGKYLEDPFIDAMCEGVKRFLPLSSPINLSIQRNIKTYFNHPKNPIINRGTYIRTKSIDAVVQSFVEKIEGPKQIVSIGAGSDTRFLNLLARSKDSNICVFEYDFETSVKVKKLTIQSNPTLGKVVNIQGDQAQIIQSHEQFEGVDPVLDTPHYKLLPVDLRSAESYISAFDLLDTKVPTLILSECVLCYMSIEESNAVLRHLTEKLEQGVFLVYEPIGGDDSFSQVMIQNLSARGIEIPNLLHFKSLDSQIARFKALPKIDRVQITDLDFCLNHWIDGKELMRINRLEFLDELEEMRLINKHYCLCVAQWGNISLQIGKSFIKDTNK